MKPNLVLTTRLSGFQRTLPMLAFLLLFGRVQGGQYNVQHNFVLRPRGNVVPQVQAVYYAHAWGRTFGPNCASSDVQPPPGAQPPGWGAFGTDRLASQDNVRHRNNGSTITANRGMQNVGAGGLPLTTWTANAQGCADAPAQANSQISVNAFGAGTPVTGTIRSFGFAEAFAPPPRRAESYAFSMAMVQARGGKRLKDGSIRWGKVVHDSVSGHTGARRQVDPIQYTVGDLVTGQVTTGTLFSVTLDIGASPTGGVNWENDLMDITAPDVILHLEFPSTNSSLQGELHVEVTGGVVTTAKATGHYAGSAPPVGATVPLQLAVPNEVEFDYDLGDYGDHDLDVGLDLSGAGETTADAVSEVPWLTTTRPNDSILTVEYYTDGSPWLLEFTHELNSSSPWMTILFTPQVTEDRVIYYLPLPTGEPSGFFRLRKAPQGDTQPPTFTAQPQCGAPVVLVQFSEPVQPAGASNPLSYHLTPTPLVPMQVMQVQLLTPQSVMLVLNQPLLPGSAYELSIQGVSDLAGNAILPGTKTTFNCPR